MQYQTMAVVKLTSSGKAVQFIDDEGNVFMTSLSYLKGLLDGRANHGFIYLTRLPLRVSDKRFKMSNVYNPKCYRDLSSEELKISYDAISPKVSTELQ